MNKAYKVVFNEATGTYIAVAEFVTTKKKGGCKSSLKTVASVLMLSGALLGANDAMAAASTGAREPATRLALAKSHQEAMHCAHLVLPAKKIDQLQEQVWGADKARVLAYYQQHFPKLKLDANSIQCD